MTPRFPFISIPPPASHGATALQAYNIALETGGAQSGRRVKIDFSQSAHPPERGGARGRGHQANDGTRDIGNTQAPVVLLRGLDFSSSPETIAQGLRTSAGPGKTGAKGMNRIILIKDKYSNASWGFAFVEFVDIQVSQLLPSCQDCSLFFPHIVLIYSSCGIDVASTTSFRLSYRRASHRSVIRASVLVSTSRGKHASRRVLCTFFSCHRRSRGDMGQVLGRGSDRSRTAL